MTATDVILTVRYVPTHKAGGPRGVGRFIRYVQYRDLHMDSGPQHDLDAFLRYVRHRDPTSPRGQMFDAAGPAGDAQRRQFMQYITRSTRDLQRGDRGRSTTRERGVYRLILSPRDARGLDLKRLTRAAMIQLATDTGHDLPPWIAGEHRNTAHPHVHLILAGRRELKSGDFRTLLITKDRLARMKGALRLEMTWQREHRLTLTGIGNQPTQGLDSSPPAVRTFDRHINRGCIEPNASSMPETLRRTRTARQHVQQETGRNPTARIAITAARISRQQRREAERLAQKRHLLWDDDAEQVRTLR